MSTPVEPLGIATLIIAAMAGGLIVRQNGLWRRSVDLSIRPLLAEAVPTSHLHTDVIQFRPPGRESVMSPPATLYLKDDGTTISVPFRNIGAGVAVITSATTDPPDGTASVQVSRKFVPVGEAVRVNVSRLPGSNTGEGWAMKGFAVAIHYVDSAGRQAMTSRADIREYATHRPFVESISIFRKGKSKPFAVGRSQD